MLSDQVERCAKWRQRTLDFLSQSKLSPYAAQPTVQKKVVLLLHVRRSPRVAPLGIGYVALSTAFDSPLDNELGDDEWDAFWERRNSLPECDREGASLTQHPIGSIIWGSETLVHVPYLYCNTTYTYM
jgi:hypothetical protein